MANVNVEWKDQAMRQVKEKARMSRRTTLRTAGGGVAAIAALLGAGGLTNSAAAQSGEGIEGLWRLGGTFMGAPLPPQLNYFAPGGMLVNIPPATQTRTMGIGHRVRTGDRRYETTIWLIRNNDAGMLDGTTKLQGRIDLNEALDSYRSAVKITLFNVAGNVINTTEATVEAIRLNAEPFE